MSLLDDFDFKKKTFGGGSVKVTTWHSPEEITAHLIEYKYIPVAILVRDEGDAFGLELYLQSKRMQGERTIALEDQMVSRLRSGGTFTRDYLLGELREAIAKTIDPTCKDADDLLNKRWYDWNLGDPHPDGRDDVDEDD